MFWCLKCPENQKIDFEKEKTKSDIRGNSETFSCLKLTTTTLLLIRENISKAAMDPKILKNNMVF